MLYYGANPAPRQRGNFDLSLGFIQHNEVVVQGLFFVNTKLFDYLEAMSKSSQKNTIFNYFVKSPSTGNTTPKNGAQSTSVSAVASPAANGASSTTPRRPTLTPSNKDTPKLKVKKGFALQTPIQKTINATNFTEVDLVWAKLDGYPWWPSLVCQHPVKKMIQLKGKVHVQFFDDPPTRYSNVVKKIFIIYLCWMIVFYC